MIWNNIGHEYDELAKEIVKDNCNYLIWGAGETGSYIYHCLKDKINIIGFIDNNAKSIRPNISGVKVFLPQTVENKKDYRILVSPAFYSDIKEELDQEGLKENIDYFHAALFTTVFLMYKYNQLYISSTDISLTEKCTFNCEKCNMYMPYYKDPVDNNIENVLNDIDCYFSYVTYLKEIHLIGGETFLYPYLGKVIEHLVCKYSKNIGKIIINTNGTIIPNKDITDQLKSELIEVRISDYTDAVKYAKVLEKTIQYFSHNKIKFSCSKMNWCDFGFPENPINLSDAQELKRHFDLCGVTFRGLYNKKYYFCHSNTSAVRSGLFDDNDNDYLDLSSTNKKIFMEYELGYSKLGYCTFCKVCRGCASDLIVDSGIQCSRNKKGNNYERS